MKELETQIDEYLDLVIRGSLVFQHGIRNYLDERKEDFEKRCDELDRLESRADRLRRTITGRLYTHTLIPESRGDVLGLLESSDKVLNISSATLLEFSIEKPLIVEETKELFRDLADASVAAVESMVSAVRCYFRDLTSVRDNINKVSFYEKEADKTAEKIKRIVFRDESLRLSRRIHICYFVRHIDQIADAAEDVCDRLAIAAIKRDM